MGCVGKGLSEMRSSCDPWLGRAWLFFPWFLALLHWSPGLREALACLWGLGLHSRGVPEVQRRDVGCLVRLSGSQDVPLACLLLLARTMHSTRPPSVVPRLSQCHKDCRQGTREAGARLAGFETARVCQLCDLVEQW